MVCMKRQGSNLDMQELLFLFTFFLVSFLKAQVCFHLFRLVLFLKSFLWIICLVWHIYRIYDMCCINLTLLNISTVSSLTAMLLLAQTWNGQRCLANDVNQRNLHVVSTLRTSTGARCDNFFFLCCSISVRWYKIKFWDCQTTCLVGLWASLNCPFLLLLLLLDLDVSLSFRQRCKVQVDHYVEKYINNSVTRNSLLNILCLFSCWLPHGVARCLGTIDIFKEFGEDAKV
jgi:hypothetical protein